MGFIIYLIVPIFLGFFLIHAAENRQLFARVKGASTGYIANGFQAAMEGMLYNRLGAVIFHFVTSFYIENGGELYLFILAIIASSIALFVYNISLLRDLSVFRATVTGDLLPRKEYQILLIASYLAPIFILTGLSFPYALGIIFYDFRLTLANLGFIFNTFFTLLTVLIIDKTIARLIDLNPKIAGAAAHSIVKVRIFGIGTYLLVLLAATSVLFYG